MTNPPRFIATVQASAIHTGDERLVKVVVRISGPPSRWTVGVGGRSKVRDGSELVLEVRGQPLEDAGLVEVIDTEIERIFETSQWAKTVRLVGDVLAEAEVIET